MNRSQNGFYGTKLSKCDREDFYSPCEKEYITMIQKLDGHVLLYGPSEKLLELVYRLREKGFDIQIQIMHPCL